VSNFGGAELRVQGVEAAQDGHAARKRCHELSVGRALRFAHCGGFFGGRKRPCIPCEKRIGYSQSVTNFPLLSVSENGLKTPLRSHSDEVSESRLR